MSKSGASSKMAGVAGWHQLPAGGSSEESMVVQSSVVGGFQGGKVFVVSYPLSLILLLGFFLSLFPVSCSYLHP